jgi:ATPase family AAA domain-containing protein 3A/B
VELVRMQEESSLRKEQTRRATEEQIQAQQRHTEKERAEIERETIRVKAIAEAEGRAHEARLTEEYNKRMLVEKMSGEREKWLAAINTTFAHIEGFTTLFYCRAVSHCGPYITQILYQLVHIF